MRVCWESKGMLQARNCSFRNVFNPSLGPGTGSGEWLATSQRLDGLATCAVEQGATLLP